MIAIEPEEELVGLSDYMEQYLRSKTYLKVSDPQLWDKVISNLSVVRTDENFEVLATSKV